MRISDWSSDVCSSDLDDIAERRVGRLGEEIFGARVGGGHTELQAEIRRMPLAAMRVTQQIFELEPPRLGAAAEAVGVGDVAGITVVDVVLRMLERRVARREIENQCGSIAAGPRRDIVAVDNEALL